MRRGARDRVHWRELWYDHWSRRWTGELELFMDVAFRFCEDCMKTIVQIPNIQHRSS
jgi:hypothetical protein